VCDRRSKRTATRHRLTPSFGLFGDLCAFHELAGFECRFLDTDQETSLINGSMVWGRTPLEFGEIYSGCRNRCPP
jgi:hypothetical protein